MHGFVKYDRLRLRASSKPLSLLVRLANIQLILKRPEIVEPGTASSL